MGALAGLLVLFFAGLLSGGVVVSWWLRRRQLRAEIDRVGPSLDDDAVRAILTEGSLWVEEAPPLDLDEIAEEEERFWSNESWDSAEEL